VTITATPALADGRSPGDAHPRSRWALAEHVTVAAALIWWGFALTHATGGRDPWAQTIGIALAVVALGAVRPWRVLTPWTLVLAAAIAAAPIAVCLIDPTHWFGASQAATYAYSAVLFVTVRAYADTSARRTALIALVLGAGVAQLAWSMIAWVGGGDPAGLMVGTFYWHNQFAAFLLAPAIIGAGVAAVGTGQLRLAGTVTAIAGSAGVVLSTSRASMALLAGGWLLAGALAVLTAAGLRGRLLAAVRFLVLAGVAVAVTVLLPGPPLFSHRVSALASTTARGAQQSVSQNSGFRVDFWRQALSVFGHHPLTGAGFGSFGSQASRLDPNGVHSALVHSGLLQPLSDGGLLLGLPFLLGCLLIGLGLLRRLLPSAWRADQGAVTLVAVGSLVLAAHSAVDFDWTYPSLMAMSAILAALALAWTPTRADAGSRRPAASPVGARVACVVLAVAGLVLAQQSVHGGWHLTAPAPHSVPLSGDPAS
jgi:O-antigen ligase